MDTEPRQYALQQRQSAFVPMTLLMLIILLALGRFAYVRVFYKTPDVTSPALIECSTREISVRAKPATTRSPAWRRDSNGLRYYLEWTVLAELDDGRLACPVWITTEPRFGPFMNVYTVYTWSRVRGGAALSELPQPVQFPKVPGCVRYYLILREFQPRTQGQTPSPRVAVQDVLPDDVVSGVLTIQEVSELPALDEHRLHSELTEAYDDALAARDEMRFRE